jgi:replication-associated recombination protein RarA
MVNKLFTGKYRPQTLEEIILPERIRKDIGNGELKQNYLFHGIQGTGKTSLAKILSKDYPTLYINVSESTGVDSIRTTITDWCSTISVLDGKSSVKVVILDEMDGASDQWYKALRGTIEKFTENGLARFIGTCNFVNNIPDPVLDRFECISFNCASKTEEKEMLVKYIKRTMGMFKSLGITISQDAAVDFVKRNFPSMRKIVSKIQSFYDKGIKEISIEDIKTLNYSFNDIFKLIMTNTDPYENYILLMGQYVSKVDDVLASLGTELPDYIRENYNGKLNKLPMILIEVANYQSQRVHVVDPAISMLACVMKLQMIMNS